LRDAEAYTIFGKPDPGRDTLASLRARGPDDRARELEGQRWRICEDIGHPLDQRLVVGRTTSQDAGVTQNANIVVATAALEVGFNDPQVGAVIQHKAPRGMASFLQRKGRAGRDRAMRPLTVTVLSDYGRDRALFQSYERLFDPELAPQFLPVANPYVLKMQATFAFFDWLADEATGYEKAWAWDYLSRPLPQTPQSVAAVLQRVKAKLAAVVQGDEATVASLRRHLMGALQVDDATAQSLLWEAPRSILLEAAPTLVRRLFRQWRLAFPNPGSAHDHFEPYHPLPDFVPRNLFSDLSLPEVRIVLPPATVNHEERTESMPVLQALRQLVPGRVTRRFAFERGALSHWVPVDPAVPVQDRKISEYAEDHEFVGEFVGRFNDPTDDQALLVFRPWTVRLAKVARTEALPSSNAHLAWRTDIVANGEPLSVPVAPRSPWRPFVASVDFFLHRHRASAGVRRFAQTAHATVRTLQDEFSVAINFRSDDDRPAAIGFELDVDGLRLDLSLPGEEQLSTCMLTPTLLRDCKFAYLREGFRSDRLLPPDLNIFQRDWLFQLLCAVLGAETAANPHVAEATAEVLDDARIDGAFQSAMNEFFGVPSPGKEALSNDDDDEEEEEEEEVRDGGGDATVPTTPRAAGRLQQALTAQLARPEVRARLRAIAAEFATPDPVRFDRWLRRLVLETLGEAMLQACIAAAPRQATVDNLLVDIREDPETGIATLWITETTLGGAGALQAFAERFAAEPGVFFDAVEAALAPTDLELVDGGLRRIVSLACDDLDVRENLGRLRSTDSHLAGATLWEQLAQRLARQGGVDLSHALVVAFNSRLLRPGAGPALDALLAALAQFWDETESRLTVSVGLREFAYVVACDVQWRKRITDFLATSLPGGGAGHVSVFAATVSMLWPRASEVRRTSLQSYHPFREVRQTDPAVVRHLLLRRTVREVELASPGWRDELNAAFEADGACRLIAEAPEAGLLRAALVQLSATPVAVGVLQFFPVLDRIDRAEGRILVDLVLREHG
jgi:hypothetical protein